MYGGNASVGYVQSVINLTKVSETNKLDLTFTFIWNDSLVTRARNNIVDEFLESNSDYLIFVDADIQFNPLDLLYMVELAETDKEKQIICAAYPMKTIDWNLINKANQKGYIKTPEDNLKYQSKYVVNFSQEEKNEEIIFFDLDKPVKVYQSGTGFMLIAKNVFYKFKEKYPEQEYFDQQNNKNKIAFFDCKINPKTKDYMSEDWMFCDYMNKININTWLIPWISLNHFGTYNYVGNFAETSKSYIEILNN